MPAPTSLKAIVGRPPDSWPWRWQPILGGCGYEFDFYNDCSLHWRDWFYGGNFLGHGGIGICP